MIIRGYQGRWLRILSSLPQNIDGIVIWKNLSPLKYFIYKKFLPRVFGVVENEYLVLILFLLTSIPVLDNISCS